MTELTLRDRAKRVKAVILDSDGVFFTGRVLVDPERGEVLKERSHIDGQGISFLRAAGIRIAFVSGGIPGFLTMTEQKLNSLPSVKNGIWPPVAVFTSGGPQRKDKVAAIEEWLKDCGIEWEECAYMGDDISDYEMIGRVGLSAAPIQAEEIIKKAAHFVASRRGGDGAIRDLANFILDAQGIDILTLSLR